MEFFGKLIELLDTPMAEPKPWGWFHILGFILSIVAGLLLCLWHKRSPSDARVRRIVFWTAVVVLILEIYKQFNFSFSYEEGKVLFNYQWYAFPWQFCSTPMYVGFLTGFFRKGRVHDALCSYLATYAVFAGLIVMCIPTSIFVETIGINIQTMVCHGSMITVGIYLWYSGYVKAEHKTILKALSVFAVTLLVAMILNEVAHWSGLLETHSFNMFYISPYQEPHLPIYSDVQRIVPYPWNLFIYIVGFTFISYLILLIAKGSLALSRTLKKR